MLRCFWSHLTYPAAGNADGDRCCISRYSDRPGAYGIGRGDGNHQLIWQYRLPLTCSNNLLSKALPVNPTAQYSAYRYQRTIPLSVPCRLYFYQTRKPCTGSMNTTLELSEWMKRWRWMRWLFFNRENTMSGYILNREGIKAEEEKRLYRLSDLLSGRSFPMLS